MTKEFIKESCAPHPNKNKDELLPYTCYTRDTLLKLRELWNVRHQDMKIETKSPRKIWEFLRNNLKDTCNKESCWLRQNFAQGGFQNGIQSYLFAPKAPSEWKKNINEWLSSVDIQNVMKQYEEKYPCFEFLGPSPIDYDTKIDDECVFDEICNFSILETLQEGKYKVGIVFNTDPHFKGGEHWFALFIHLKEGKIYYFDSYASPPTKEIQRLVKNIQMQGKMLGKEFEFIQNKIVHQMKNSECGMYSLYFIIQMLKNNDFQHFENKRITDEKMEKLRYKYFNIN